MEQPSSEEPSIQNEEPPSLNGPRTAGSFFNGQTQLLAYYPDFYDKTLNYDQKQYFGHNGHLKLIKSLHIKIETNLVECKKLWNELSPQESLFDLWDFRYAWWLGYQHQPYFLTLRNGEQNLGLLPLWYEADRQGFFWFGSDWHEDNTFFVKDPILAPLLLAASPQPVKLNAILKRNISWPEDMFLLEKDDSKFIIDLTNITSLDQYLSLLKKKKRYNLRRDQRIINEQNPQIIINRFTDLESLISLSIARFAQKGENNTWLDQRRRKTFQEIIKLANQGQSTFKIKMFTIVINANVAAVDIIAIYKNQYYALKGGNDVKNYPGIGSYMNLLEIEDAIKLGMRKIDFLEEDCGWKHSWFQEIPLYKYQKGVFPLQLQNN